MKNLMITVAALIALAAPAAAFELGATGVNVDNTVELSYDFETETRGATWDVNVNYAFGENILAYAETDFNLEDFEYTGLDVGVIYQTPIEALTVDTYATFDDEWTNTNLVVAVTAKF